nr:hypothetical protein [Allomuricauda sp.]
MTSISELMRPKPSNGYSDWPNLQKHHSHTEGNNLAPPYNASHHTAVFHPAVNSTANYPMFCGAFSRNWQTGYTEGMPLFICRQHRESNDKRGTLTGRHVSHNLLASIPVLNYYLTLGSCDQAFIDNMVKKYNLNRALIPYPTVRTTEQKPGTERNYTQSEEYESFIDDFNKKWSFIGIIKNDMDLKSRYQKLFNITVRGRCRSFNLWTTRISSKYSRSEARDRVGKGDDLYLTLKRVPIDNDTFKLPDGTNMPIIPQCENSNMVWQIRASRRSIIARRRPQNLDANGLPQQHMHIGKVLSAISKKPDEHYQKRAFREHTQMTCLPMVEIATHIGM